MFLWKFSSKLKCRDLSAKQIQRCYSQRKILFFGTDNFSLPSLKLITKENAVHSRLEVVTSFKSKKNPVKDFASEHKLPVHDWKSVKQDQKFCCDFDIGLIVSFGHLIPEHMIKSFANGMLNVHASLLPKYRGASPIIYAIKNREPTTGVSIMQIKPQKFDVGDVLAMREVPIHNDMLMPELHDKLANMGAELLVECLKNLESCKPVQQDDSRASYAPKVDKDFCKVRWGEMSAQEIYDLYRALYSYKHVQTTFKCEPVKLLELSIPPQGAWQNAPAGHIGFCRKAKKLIVRCADSNYVEINRLLIGKKVMSPADFNNGFLKNLNESERTFE